MELTPKKYTLGSNLWTCSEFLGCRDMWLVVDIDIQFIWRMWNTPLKPNFIPSIWYSQHCYFAILSKFQKSRNFQVSRTHTAKKRKWRLVKVVTVDYKKSVINKKWKEIKWWLQRTYSNETRNNKNGFISCSSWNCVC